MGSSRVGELDGFGFSNTGSPKSCGLLDAGCSAPGLLLEVGVTATRSVLAVCSATGGGIVPCELEAAVLTGSSWAEGGGNAGGGGLGLSVGVSTGIPVIGRSTGWVVVVLVWLTPALAQLSAPQGVTGIGGSKIPSFPPQYLPHFSHAPLYVCQIVHINIWNRCTLRLHSSTVIYTG